MMKKFRFALGRKIVLHQPQIMTGHQLTGAEIQHMKIQEIGHTYVGISNDKIYWEYALF